MIAINQQNAPDDALLLTWRGGRHPERWGQYADCFATSIDRVVTLSQWVNAFYTSPVFRLERWILRLLAQAPSSDRQALEVADGLRDDFAVWIVGARTTDQLLMCDRYGKTRSWFRVAAQPHGTTLLQFGSAVASRRRPGGESGMSAGFKALLGFHKIYSKVLVRSAAAKLR